MNPDKIEELRATLLDFEDEEVLEALILNNILDRDSGLLTEWWLNILNPDLIKKNKADTLQQEEIIVLSALARLIQRRIKIK